MNPDVLKALRRFKTAPGQMTTQEVYIVKEFLLDYKEIRDMYKQGFGIDPNGLTIESNIESADWYIDYLKEK